MSDFYFDMQMLRARMAGIGESLDGAWSEKLRDHLHLDRGSKECAYWHSGYHQALADLLCLMEGSQPIVGTSDTSNRYRVAG